MKVLLINPPQIFSKYQVATGIVPPLGPAYLASFLLHNNIDVELIDALGEEPEKVTQFKGDVFLRGISFSDICSRVHKDTKLIGVSNLFSFAFPAVVELIEALKETHANIPIVLGGAHPTHLAEYTLSCTLADYVITGEGEIPLLELTKYLDGEILVDEVPSLVYKDLNQKIRSTSKAPRIQNLDSINIPFPARDMLPIEKYIGEQEAHGSTNDRWTTILSSRGCPYGCTFCDSRKTQFIARTAEDVVDEIELCIDKFGIREFHFEDDNMTVKKSRLIGICDEIINRKLDIKWQTPNGIRASVTDEEMLLKMKESGCTHITLAPESGSERVLNEIILKGRDFSLDQLIDLGSLAHKLNIKCAAYFILGLPGETVEDLKQTIKYANKLARKGVDEVAFGLFIPLPGTPLWDEVVKKYGQPDFLDLLVIGDLSKAVSWSESLTDRQLNSYRKKAYIYFHINRLIFHPIKFLITLFNITRGVAETKTEDKIRSFIKRRNSSNTKNDSSQYSDGALYTPYNGSRSIKIIIKNTPIYGYSNSLYKALRYGIKSIFSKNKF